MYKKMENHMKYKLLLYTFLIIFILTLFSFNSLFADEIVLNNGDVLIGKIIAENDYEVRIQTSFGEIPVAKKNIQTKSLGMTERKGEKAQLIMRDGSVIEGSIIGSTAEVVKFRSSVGIIEVNRSDIARIAYLDDQTFQAAVGKSDGDPLTAGSKLIKSDEELLAKKRQYIANEISIETVSDPEIDEDRWYIRQGNVLLSEEEFLARTDHHDERINIKTSAQNREILHYTFMILGGISLAGTYGFAAFDITSADNSDDSDLYWSVACLGATIGFGLIAYGMFPLKDHYLSYSKAKQYTESHNIKLRQQLGLTKSDVTLSKSMQRDLANIDNRYKRNVIRSEVVVPISFRF